MAALLPSLASDFNSAAYWEEFNKRTGEFEWYGSYDQLRPTVEKHVKPGASVLVIGCGNSTFSADLHDSGVTTDIVNIDFDESVVWAMRERNAGRSPAMRWETMDMRDLAGFEAAAFDVVLDKGALDALMSSADKAIAADADRMLASVARVLRPGGSYVCISLAQSFVYERVARALADHFASADAHILQEASGESSLVPFCFALHKRAANEEVRGASPTSVTMWFDGRGRRKGGERGKTKVVTATTCGQIIQDAQGAFRMEKTQGKLQALKPGRVEKVELWGATYGGKGRGGGGGGGGGGGFGGIGKSGSAGLFGAQGFAHIDGIVEEGVEGDGGDNGDDDEPTFNLAKGPKYTLTVMDVAPELGGGKSQAVVAFIVPQGREHEYLFSTDDGLRQIAESADCCRFLSVTLNRGHTFESLEAVQADLSQTVRDFAPDCRTIQQERIPFVTTGDALGSRDVVARGQMDGASGGDDYLVEESEIDGGLVRRLVFETNTNVIQTEVRLVERRTRPQSGGGAEKSKGSGGGKKGGGKKGKGKKKGGGKKSGKKAAQGEGEGEGGEDPAGMVVVDYTYLCFDYHRAILAGLAIVSRLLEPEGGAAMATGGGSGVVIGLGGGALPMVLRHFFPAARLTVCELDATVVAVAKEWFGFCETPFGGGAGERGGEEGEGGAGGEVAAPAGGGGLVVWVGDGLAMNLGEARHAVVVIDVDSKDTTVGMSCPPTAFVAPGFLAKVRRALVPGGVLVVNVAARSQAMYESTLEAIQAAFSDRDGGGDGGDGACDVLTLKPSDDDVNTVVFAVNGRAPPHVRPSADGGKQHGGKKQQQQQQQQQQPRGGAVDLRREVRKWLERVPEQRLDPLELLDLAGDVVLAVDGADASASGSAMVRDDVD